jgi:hypothetical protein
MSRPTRKDAACGQRENRSHSIGAAEFREEARSGRSRGGGRVIYSAPDVRQTSKSSVLPCRMSMERMGSVYPSLRFTMPQASTLRAIAIAASGLNPTFIHSPSRPSRLSGSRMMKRAASSHSTTRVWPSSSGMPGTSSTEVAVTRTAGPSSSLPVRLRAALVDLH